MKVPICAPGERAPRILHRLADSFPRWRDLSSGEEETGAEPVSAPPPRIGRCRALVVGIDAYPSSPLNNAVRDAQALARLLDRDFGFELVGGAPLLNEEATLPALRQGLGRLFGGDPEVYDQNLFFFAGHGLENGSLLTASRSDATLPIQKVLDAFRASPARGVFILDSCFAGQALRQLARRLEAEQKADAPGRGAVHLLAAGGPDQRIPDGPPGEHSPFSACLLAFLDGRLGQHDGKRAGLPCGTLPVSRFKDQLENAVAEHSAQLQERLGQRWIPPDVLVEPVRPSDSGGRGLFYFVPRRSRLAPELVAGLRRSLRRDEPGDRRRLLRQLGEAIDRRWDDAGQRRWDLPLVFDLLVENLRELHPEDLLRLDRRPYGLGPPRERERAGARSATARGLGRVADAAWKHLEPQDPRTDAEDRRQLRRGLRATRMALLHLALRDPDPVVRHAAGKALDHGGWGKPEGDGEDQPSIRRQLLGLRARASRRARRRLRPLLTRFPESPGGRPPDRLLLAIYAGLDLARRGWRRRLLRLPLKLAFGATAATYGLIFSTFHVDTAPSGRLIARLGPPGLEAFPLAGRTVLGTPWHENHLVEQRLPRDPPPWGLWLSPRGLDWGRPIVNRMRAEHAVPTLWRLGESRAAEKRLRTWAERGRPRAVAWAAYLSLHGSSAVDVVALATHTLGTRRGTQADPVLEIIANWCTVTGRKSEDSWAPALRQACRPPEETSAISAEEMKPAAAAAVDLTTLEESLASPDSATRSEALRRLVGTLEQARLEPDQLAAADRLLTGALGDPRPWNRLEASDGLLVLGLAAEPVYGRAFSLAMDELEDDRSGVAGRRLAKRFAKAPSASTLRLLTRLANWLAISRHHPIKDHVFNQLIEELTASLLARDLGQLPAAVEALLPLIGAEAADEAPPWLWRHAVQKNLERVTASRPEVGAALALHLVERLDAADLRRRRAAAWLLGVSAPWLEDPEAAWSRLAAQLSSVLSGDGPPPDAAWLDGLAFSLADLSRADPERRGRASELLIALLRCQRVPPLAKRRLAWHLRYLAGAPAPARATVRTLLPQAAAEDRELRSLLADSLLRWLGEDPTSWFWLAPHLDARLQAETDLDIRATWWAARGLVHGGEASREAVDALARLHDRGAASALYRAAVLGAARPEAADAVISVLDARWRHSNSLDPNRCTVYAHRLAGRDPELARRVLERLVVPMLREQPGRAGWQAVHNGLGGLVKLHPSLAPEALRHLDHFIQRLETGRADLGEVPAQTLARVLEETWLHIAGLCEGSDPHLLERSLRSSSGWRRDHALELLIRIARQSPARRPELRGLTTRLRTSWRPAVRVTGTRALEALNLLELDAQLDARGRQALRQLLNSAGEASSLPDNPRSPHPP